MLEDRSYMRDPEFRSGSPYLMLFVVLGLNFLIFILAQVEVAYGTFPWMRHLPLIPADLKNGYVWQLLTFQFLHVDGWHFVLNMLMLYMFGRPVIEAIGNKHFTALYLASGLAGGLLQGALGLVFPKTVFENPVVGASAGVFGMIAAFATLDPERELMWFFVLRMKAKVMLWIATGIALFYVVVPASRGVAHAAHLGGIIMAFLYIRQGLHHKTLSIRFSWHPLRNRARRRQLVKAATLTPGFWKGGGKGPPAEQVEPEEFISREVDPILDKISAHGIQSLTPREKQILEAARAKMDKR